MSGNQEISRDPIARTAANAISTPCVSRRDSRFFRHWGERGGQPLHRILEQVRIVKYGCGLGPYDFACDQHSLTQTAPKRLGGGCREFWIGAENVNQDVGIDGSDQRRARSCAITASVSIFLPRHPYTSLTGSTKPLLTATSRPCSSLNSSTVPGFMPSLSLNPFGIVTWPRSATRAFILFMYVSMNYHHEIFKHLNAARLGASSPGGLPGDAQFGAFALK